MVTGNQFFFSRVGKVCENHIKTEMVCRESALQLKEEYVKTKGHGVDLPFGCILDKTNVGLEDHYVYWNPNGSAISKDPNIREICLEKLDQDPLKGMIIILLNRISLLKNSDYHVKIL